MLSLRIFLVIILISAISSTEFDLYEKDTKRFDYMPSAKVLKIRQSIQKGPIFIKKKKPNDNGIF
jgi:hypothetical protein